MPPKPAPIGTDKVRVSVSPPSYAGLSPASAVSSRAKRANRKVDTRHECLLRKELWRRGLRYRKHVDDLPGKPDIVFPRARLVVFCDGDFWHGRDWAALRAKLAQGTNSAYWLAKIGTNRERDRLNTHRLETLGWQVLRVWETDVRSDVLAAADRIASTLQHRGLCR